MRWLKSKKITFSKKRIDDLIEKIQYMFTNDNSVYLPISKKHDELDAIAFGINRLKEELVFYETQKRTGLQTARWHTKCRANHGECHTRNRHAFR